MYHEVLKLTTNPLAEEDGATLEKVKEALTNAKTRDEILKARPIASVFKGILEVFQ